jgi:hypothetical protein
MALRDFLRDIMIILRIQKGMAGKGRFCKLKEKKNPENNPHNHNENQDV